MDWNILELLQGENRTVAWVAAALLAAGGTGLVTAGTLQWQRWRRKDRGTAPAAPRRPARRRGDRPAGVKPALTPQPAVPSAAQGRAMAAYQAARAAAQPPAVAVEAAETGVLDSLLERLHTAAARLEDVAASARTSTRFSEDPSAMEFDVEFIHRRF